MTNCRTIIIILHLNFVFIILKRYLEKKLHIKITDQIENSTIRRIIYKFYQKSKTNKNSFY